MNRHDLTEVEFPPAPWALHGQGLMVFSFPRSRHIEDWLPGCSVQSLWMGRTLSGYYIAEYDTPLIAGDPKPWHEWGNIKGYASTPRGNGFWIDAMGVDSNTALRGGQAIWGLQKFRTTIECERGTNGGRIQQTHPHGNTDIVWKEHGPALALSHVFPFVTEIEDRIHFYAVKMQACFRLCRIQIMRQDQPLFSALRGKKYWGVRFTDADVIIAAPRDRSLQEETRWMSI